MNSKNKAQVSIEMLIIVGIVVLGAIIFATYYLSSVNRNIDTVTDLDSDLSRVIPSEQMGSTTQVPNLGGGTVGGGSFNLCGNDQINPPEQCDGLNLNGKTCQSLGYASGSLTCQANCQFNLASCGVAPTHFTIVSSAVGSGTINPLGSTQVIAGGNQTYTFTANPGHIISSIVVDNLEVSPISSTYTFSNVLMNHTIEVTFESQPITHIIYASAGPNGTISPSGNVMVPNGNNQTFTFSPAPNYRVGSVLIDDVSIGGGEIGIIANLSSKENSAKYVLNFSDVDEKNTLNFAANNPPLVVGNNTYTFENVISNHSIHVNFVPIATPTYTLTYIAGANGTISGITPQNISQGGCGSQVTAVPNSGYVFSMWSDGNTSASRTDGAITSNQTFTASFTDDQENFIAFNLNPNNSSAVATQNFSIQVDSTGSSSALRFNLTVQVFKGQVLSSDCKYNGVNGNSFTLETNKAPEIKSYNFSCDTTGNYKFKFKLVQTGNSANQLEKNSFWNITPASVIATPVATPVGGTYYNNQSVTLTTTTPGAEIRYTTNSTNPTCSTGTVYSSPISITTTTNLRAIACVAGSTPSSIMSQNYFLRVDAPQPNVTPGTYSTPQTVSLSTITSGAQIYYTLDSTAPYDAAYPDSTTGTLYTAPIVISSPVSKIRIMAYKAGYQDSDEYIGYYYITSYCNNKMVPLYVSDHTGLYTYNRDVLLSSEDCTGNFENPNNITFTNPKIDGNIFSSNSSNNSEDLFCESHGGTFVSRELSSNTAFTRYSGGYLLMPNQNPPPINQTSSVLLWGYDFGSGNNWQHSHIVCDFTQ